MEFVTGRRFADHQSLPADHVFDRCTFDAGFTIDQHNVTLSRCVSLADSFIRREANRTILEGHQQLRATRDGLRVEAARRLRISGSEFAYSGLTPYVDRAGVSHIVGVGLRLENVTTFTIENCLWHHNSWDGCQTVHQVGDGLIRGCRGHDNGHPDTSHGDALNIAGLVDCTICDCRFWNNWRNGLTVKLLYGGSVQGDTRDLVLRRLDCRGNATGHPGGAGLHIEDARPDRDLMGVTVTGGQYGGNPFGIVSAGRCTIHRPVIDGDGAPAGDGVSVTDGHLVLTDPVIRGGGNYGIQVRSGRLDLAGGLIDAAQPDPGRTFRSEWAIVRRSGTQIYLAEPPEVRGDFRRGRFYGLQTLAERL